MPFNFKYKKYFKNDKKWSCKLKKEKCHKKWLKNDHVLQA